MEKLIRALEILSKYTNTEEPLICSGNRIFINSVYPGNVTEADIKILKKSGIKVIDGSFEINSLKDYGG